MGTDGAKLLAITILVSLLIGVLVLVFNDDYTIEKNVKSNRDYCPTIEAYWDRPATTKAAPGATRERQPSGDRGSRESQPRRGAGNDPAGEAAGPEAAATGGGEAGR